MLAVKQLVKRATYYYYYYYYYYYQVSYSNELSKLHYKEMSISDMELGHWVAGSMGHLGHLFSLGHRVTGSSL